MKLHYVVLGAALLFGCKGSQERPANKEAPAPVVKVAAEPASSANAQPVAKTPADRVKELADPTKVAERATSNAMVLEWNAKGHTVGRADACAEPKAFVEAVAELARAAAAGNVQCDGAVCIHYKDDNTRTAFVFADDGSLEGVLENIETADAGGTDDEVKVLRDRGGCGQMAAGQTLKERLENP